MCMVDRPQGDPNGPWSPDVHIAVYSYPHVSQRDLSLASKQKNVAKMKRWHSLDEI